MQGKNSRLHFDNSNFTETKKSMINSKQKKRSNLSINTLTSTSHCSFHNKINLYGFDTVKEARPHSAPVIL